jgi:hypothetical protein
MRNIIRTENFKKFSLLVIVLLYFASSAFAQTITVNSDTRWHSKSVSISSMDKRISDLAIEYKEYAPIPRVAFYDIGFPKDVAEFKELDGFGILLISALSQNNAELPLKKVYISIDGKEIELTLLKQNFNKQTDSTSQIVKTFGEYRVDSLYFFPVYIRKQKAELLIDFAENRVGMKLTDFGDEMPESVKKLPDTKPSGKAFLTEAMKGFMKREYPGFLDN